MIPEGLPHISSNQNALVKQVLSLKEHKRGRSASGLFILEGVREYQMAVKGGYAFEHLLFCPDIISENEMKEAISATDSTVNVSTVSKSVYQRIAYRGKTEGLVAVAKARDHSLGSLKIENPNPLILVAESPEKPGNIGALLRTADAADLDAVIIAEPRGDIYNPNVVRSSVGSLFAVKLAVGSNEEVIDFLKSRNIRIMCAAVQAVQVYYDGDFTKPSALVVGTESTGLTDEWLAAADSKLNIPMEGTIDSMNVSVSAAILIFEAKRQRRFHAPPG